MIKLKALAKLRQYFPSQTVEQYLLGEHRQNLLAIEQSLNTNQIDNTFYMVPAPLLVTVAEDSRVLFLDEFKIDDGGAESDGIITIKENTTYDVSFNFMDVAVVGAKTILLNLFINSTFSKSFTIYDSTSASAFVFPVIFNFPLAVKKNDKLIFTISNDGGVSSILIGSGLLKMKKLII